MVWSSLAGAKSGAIIINTDASSKQVSVASEQLQEKQDDEAAGASYSGIVPGNHSRQPNLLNQAREQIDPSRHPINLDELRLT